MKGFMYFTAAVGTAGILLATFTVWGFTGIALALLGSYGTVQASKA